MDTQHEKSSLDQTIEVPSRKFSDRSKGPSDSGSAFHGIPVGTVTSTKSLPVEPPPSSNEEDESNYLHGIQLVLLSLGLCLVIFVIALDNTIIGTAVPEITTVFHSLEDVGWYGAAYLVATCALQPSFGKIYTYFDVKYTFLIALLIFEVGSIVCAAATSSNMFIAGRVVAGAGAASLFSGGLTIIGYAVPLSKRALYISIISSMFGIASAIGPVLGGVFTDRVSWRWCFWINLPFGGIAMLIVFIFFKNPMREHVNMTLKDKLRELDVLGAFFLIGGVVCLLLALQWGGQTYAWGDSRVWGLLLGFGLLVIVFTAIQWYKKERATIPFRIIKQRTILSSCLFTAFVHMALYIHVYYVPLYFQAVRGVSAENSGIRFIAFLVAMTIASIIVGAAVTMLGYYAPFMWVGSAIYVVGSGLLYTLDINSNIGHWIGYQVLAGFGIGMSVQIPFIAVQVVTSKVDMPIANALVMFFNTVFGAIAVSIAENVLINTLTKGILEHAVGLDPQVVINAGVLHFRKVVPAQYLSGVLIAYQLAIANCFVIAAVTAGLSFVISFGMEWKSAKGKSLGSG